MEMQGRGLCGSRAGWHRAWAPLPAAEPAWQELLARGLQAARKLPSFPWQLVSLVTSWGRVLPARGEQLKECAVQPWAWARPCRERCLRPRPAGHLSRMAPSPWSHAALPLSSRGLRESRAVAGALPPPCGPRPGMKGSPRPRDHCGASAGTRPRAQVHVLAQDGACLRQSTWPGSGGGGGRVQTGPSGGSPVPRPRRSSPSPASSVASLPVGVCPARGTRGTPELPARPS